MKKIEFIRQFPNFTLGISIYAGLRSRIEFNIELGFWYCKFVFKRKNKENN